MRKEQLLNSIAQSGYNIGFGAKKHFITYDIYRVMPKLTSFTVLAIGVLQLTSIFKRWCTGDLPDVIGALLVIIGLLAFTVDITGKNSDRFNEAGKILIGKFNRLRNMYNETLSLDDKDIEKINQLSHELEQIEQDARLAAISEQAIGTHILTNTLFFGSMQVSWIEKELKLDFRDKFPFFHLEAFVLYIAVIVALFFAARPFIKCFQ
jgi:hypothetical protein